MDRNEFLTRVAQMKLNRAAPVKPYKPVMVAAVIVLVHKGKIGSPYVYLDGALRSVFFQLFDEMFPDWPVSTRPKPYDPFRALASEGSSTSQAMLAAAEEGHVEVWTYEPAKVLSGHLDFEQVA